MVTCERHHCIVNIGVSQVLRVSYRWQTESPRLLSQLECRGHGGVDHPSCLIWSAISSRHRLCSRRLSPWRSSDRSLQRGWRVWKRGCGLANRSDELQQSDAQHHHLPIPSNGPQIPFVRGPSVLAHMTRHLLTTAAVARMAIRCSLQTWRRCRQRYDCRQSMCGSHENADAASLPTQAKHNCYCRRLCRPSICNTPCSQSGRIQASLLQRMAVAPRVIAVHHEHSHCGLLSCGCISGARGMGGLRFPHTLQAFFSAWLIRVQRWQVHGSAVLMVSLTAGAEVDAEVGAEAGAEGVLCSRLLLASLERGRSSDAAAGSARPRFLAVPTGSVTTAGNGDVDPSASACADACA